MTTFEKEPMEFHHQGDPVLRAIEKHDKEVAMKKDAFLSSSPPPGEFHCHGDPMFQAILAHDKKLTSSIKDPDVTQTYPWDDEISEPLGFNDPLFEAVLEHDRVIRR